MLNKTHKILIIRLSSLGDIIHVYPMLNEIYLYFKSINQNCEIDWLVDESFAELIKCNNIINNIITVPLRKIKKNKLNFISEMFSWYKKIKFYHKDYDYIIDVHGMLKSSILTKFFNKNSNVYGYSIKNVKEKIACIFYNKHIKVNNTFIINKNRELASKIFNYTVDYKKSNFGLINHYKNYNNINIKDSYIICFCMASKDDKKYSFNNWLLLFEYLINKYNYKIIIPYGNQNEYNEVVKFKKINTNIIIPDNIYSYNQLHNLIIDAKFVFGVDTGLTHLANALDKKMIAIFTNTNPKDTGIFESTYAINIGNKNYYPNVNEVITLFEQIKISHKF